ncbi:MAG: SDR family oxidoreductase [Verrucomicrobiae bacterium]|nr:SDR family oxidoreductase [Verrucomicrobiae bacterium]MDW8345094.1 SDR family oxidoreductase [Verrucomicrobiae bacterium]
MDLRGKNCLVTGGAKRLGREIAMALAERGANVAVHYHTSADAAREVVRAVRARGVDAMAVRADQRRAAHVRRAVAQVAKRWGIIHVLINSAAVYERTPFDRLTERDWDFHLESNLKGPFLFALEVGRRLVAERCPGKIINFADWAAYRPYKDYLPYCVSKAGVVCLTQALAKELGPLVNVNAIGPGPVLLPPDVDEAEKKAIIQSTVLKRLGSPQDVVAAVLYLLEGGDFVTGHTLIVDGGRLIRGG